MHGIRRRRIAHHLRSNQIELGEHEGHEGTKATKNDLTRAGFKTPFTTDNTDDTDRENTTIAAQSVSSMLSVVRSPALLNPVPALLLSFVLFVSSCPSCSLRSFRVQSHGSIRYTCVFVRRNSDFPATAGDAIIPASSLFDASNLNSFVGATTLPRPSCPK